MVVSNFWWPTSSKSILYFHGVRSNLKPRATLLAAMLFPSDTSIKRAVNDIVKLSIEQVMGVHQIDQARKVELTLPVYDQLASDYRYRVQNAFVKHLLASLLY